MQVPIALTFYSTALLVRVVADGLGAVPQDTVQAATALGYRPLGRFFRVELPIAVPVITAGLRVADRGQRQPGRRGRHDRQDNLGRLFDEGFKLSVDEPYYPPIVLGIVLCVLLALVLDVLVMVPQPGDDPVATGGAGMIGDTFDWLTDPANWHSTDFDTGILAQLARPRRFSARRTGDRAGDRAATRAVDRAHRPGHLAGERGQRACARCRPSACWCCWSSSSRRTSTAAPTRAT